MPRPTAFIQALRRNSAATDPAAAGLTIEDVMAVGGWKTAAVARRYNLGNLDALRARSQTSTTPGSHSPRAERAAERSERGVGAPAGFARRGRGAEPLAEFIPLAELIERVLERLAGLELRRLGGRDLDRLARLGVAAGARLARRDGERAEAGDVHLVAVAEGGDDVIEDQVDGPLGLPFGQVQLGRHRLDQVGLRHAPSRCAPAALATDLSGVNA